MPEIQNLVGFALIALGMVLTPGPNMIYLISRSICQGPMAGLISLGGVALGFVFYMVFAALALPHCFWLYLLHLAWQAVRPGGRSPFQVRDLPKDGPRKLFLMGLVTNLLNPKVAVLYLSLLPQFIRPEQGDVLLQSLVFGSLQIIISVTVNALIAVTAGSIAAFLAGRPLFMLVQRWLMSTVLAGLALSMAAEARK
jgi:threonine/homoserine/homoserine lactone efflux protein